MELGCNAGIQLTEHAVTSCSGHLMLNDLKSTNCFFLLLILMSSTQLIEYWTLWLVRTALTSYSFENADCC